ncbi:MAG TPA: HEPN domain-containing protein, partial [Gemmataceae bacterium]
RYATQQINQAYAVLLSSHFQGFCRDLHTECVGFLTRVVRPASLPTILHVEFTWNRQLDRGNPNPGNIGSDFGRFGIEFWGEVNGHHARNPQRKRLLEELNEWRNAIAHQDFDPARLGGAITLGLRQVIDWRSACAGLASSFDEVMRAYLLAVTGLSPW